jgi:hypothetical protein
MSKVSMEVMLMEEWARVDRMVKLMVRREKIHRVDIGGSGVVHRDGDIHLCDQAPHHGAEKDQEGRGDRVGDGNH